MTIEQAKLYVGCGLTNAPESFKAEVEELKDKLREVGHYVFDFIGLVNGTDEEVYDWDIEHCVANCDLFVAVCDHDSTGLGIEICQSVNVLNKPTLAVYNQQSRLTRLVKGFAKRREPLELLHYDDLLRDVPPMINQRLTEMRQFNLPPPLPSILDQYKLGFETGNA